MAKEKEANKKGWAIIKSCTTAKQIHNAYNWVWLYKTMYGKTESWEKLYRYCTKRRKNLWNG